jgi:hypothetical protein
MMRREFNPTYTLERSHTAGVGNLDEELSQEIRRQINYTITAR